ncbi:MAG: hypothetical protein WC761_05950 [Candidatus Paceibacterota bacterium]|jgi:hypothetical protein
MLPLQVFLEACPYIERVKCKCNKRRALTFEECVLSITIGMDITERGIDPTQLCNRHLMAAIFVVNFIAKFEPSREVSSLAQERKLELQRALVRRRGLKVSRESHYYGTIEIRVHVFVTHVPLSLLRQ